MTPEELNRTIEFLVQHQAQFSVDLQRDHEMLNRGFDEMHKGFAEMHKGFAETRNYIGVLALNQRRIAELIKIESQRLERSENWQQQFQQEARARHEEALARLLEKLAGNN